MWLYVLIAAEQYFRNEMLGFRFRYLISRVLMSSAASNRQISSWCKLCLGDMRQCKGWHWGDHGNKLQGAWQRDWLRCAAWHRHISSHGPGPRGIFPAKTHDDGSDKLASFLAPHITELALANISQDGDNFPVYFFKAINCKISG